MGIVMPNRISIRTIQPHLRPRSGSGLLRGLSQARPGSDLNQTNYSSIYRADAPSTSSRRDGKAHLPKLWATKRWVTAEFAIERVFASAVSS